MADFGSPPAVLPTNPRPVPSARQRQLSIPFKVATLLIAGLLTGAIAGESAAQGPPGSIQGVVLNESGRPIEQAQVLLDPGSTQRELRTNRDGQFGFIGVSPGSHRLRILRIGFQPRDTTLALSGAMAAGTVAYHPAFGVE